jgi:hypothetical protein
MWKKLFPRWSRGQAVKKHPPMNLHSDGDYTDGEWTIASFSSRERRETRVEHNKDLLAKNDEVSSGQRVGPLVEGSCSSSQPAKEHYYASYEPSPPPEKTKLHHYVWFFFSTPPPALQVYFCILFLAIISRDAVRFLLHGISLALGFQMLTIMLKWVKYISQSPDLRDIKKYFSLSIRMPLSQLEQSIEGGAARRAMERVTLVAVAGSGLSGLGKWMRIWSISRDHMHALNGSLVTEWANWVRQEDEMYKSYIQKKKYLPNSASF